jgi:hypothetical protein
MQRIIAILRETLLADGGAGGNVLSESSSINCCTLQTFAPVWVWRVGVWREATYGIIVGLIKKNLALLSSVGQFERVLTERLDDDDEM